jgi:hydrogenase-4 membrane subunit HyfE
VTSLLIAFVFVLLVPLFVATWRMSLLGLSLQGMLLFAMAVRLEPLSGSVGSVLLVADLLLVRGVVAPLALYRELRERGAPHRNDVLPANLLAWSSAIGLVLLAFRVASELVPDAGDEQTMVAAAAAAVFLGFLVLATQVGVLSQIIGALRIENAVALFELSGGHHPGYDGLRIGQLVVLLLSVALFRWYLARIPVPAAHALEAPDPFDD